MKLVLATLLIALLGAGVHCMAGEEELDIDTRFRAKIAKEKVKEGALQRRLDALGRDTADRSADAACGSQSIGNLDTSEQKPGTPAPREVFVFAPNAINIVPAGGCR